MAIGVNVSVTGCLFLCIDPVTGRLARCMGELMILAIHPSIKLIKKMVSEIIALVTHPLLAISNNAGLSEFWICFKGFNLCFRTTQSQSEN